MRKNFEENIYKKLYFGEDVPKPRETVLFLVPNGIKLEWMVFAWPGKSHELLPSSLSSSLSSLLLLSSYVVVFIVVIIVVVIVVVDIVVVNVLVVAVR